MFHAVLGFSAEKLTGPWRVLRRVLAFGHEAVAIFIVLSGYCLMLPVVRARDERMTRSVPSFLGRRAFRILPPYYIALIASLALIASVEQLRVGGSGTIWDDSLPALEWAAICSHLVLVHNWFPAWAYQINGPLWSVATEWQIYFFFPLLLLPVWRRGGMLATLAVSALVGYLPLLLLPRAAMVAIPWYLTLFALGMAAAAVGFSRRPLEGRLRSGVKWNLVSAALWVFCLAFGGLAASVWFRLKPLTDLLVGVSTAALLIHLTRCAAAQGKARGNLLRLLESPPFVAVGHFSYSLYLTHLPVVAVCAFALRPLGLSPASYTLALLAVSMVASFSFAFAFFLGVERFFIRSRPTPG